MNDEAEDVEVNMEGGGREWKLKAWSPTSIKGRRSEVKSEVRVPQMVGRPRSA